MLDSELYALLFVLGVALLIAMLGASGWLRSKRVGIYTTALAVLMALGAGMVVAPFVQWPSSGVSDDSTQLTPPRDALNTAVGE